MDALSGATFTPSELILLRGDEFAPKAGLVNATKLLQGDLKVSVRDLARAITAGTLLANERVGVLRLEVRSKKALLGLAQTTVCVAEPPGSSYAWPPATLEARVLPIAAQLRQTRGQCDIYMLVYTLLERDSGDPWSALVEMVKAGLAQRGLLAANEKKTLGIFRSVEYSLPSNTAALAAGQSAGSVQRMLAESEHTRPDLHKRLLSEIDKAIKRRVEQSDDD